jgi:hypothetical protein
MTAFVRIMPRCRVVIHCDLGVIEDPPSRPPDGKAEGQVVVNLSSTTKQASVEAQPLNRRRPEAHVGAFQVINQPWRPYSEMVIADHAAMPQDLANY